ncbi:ceramidase domain-containing protein [Amphritea sp. HPY]|uniref:ceramidase domain-containing protein n=1 Tax=Amphritea sp. HPY TaxID=3421652 RepID=UPI003D7F10FD
MIDLYCERVDASFWAEPINALTNIGFLLSGYLMLVTLRRNKHASDTHLLLPLLCIVIGLGSFLFHTFATNWARWLDIIPILLFQLAFLWLYARNIIHLPVVVSLMSLLIYLGVALYCRGFPDILNGSLIYAPALLVLFSLGMWHYSHQLSRPTILLSASLIFLLSVSFRAMDNLICDVFPIGSHFLWHLLNALVLYLCSLSLLPAGINRSPAAENSSGRVSKHMQDKAEHKQKSQMTACMEVHQVSGRYT